jgi:hypothetical protein
MGLVSRLKPSARLGAVAATRRADTAHCTIPTFRIARVICSSREASEPV